MGSEPQSAMTDEQLARQSQAGSLASFEALVYRHEARVYRFVCQRCGNPDDARDITQAAFVSAFRNLQQFTSRSSFTSWLFAIARNRTIDFLRTRRTHEPIHAESLVEFANPASVLDACEQADALWALAREAMNVELYETLWLRYQEGLSVREIARVTHRTATGVKVTLFRARQKLASLLRTQAEDSGESRSREQLPAVPRVRSPARARAQPLMTP